MSVAYDCEPWSIGVASCGIADLEPERLAHRESVLALSNGNLGWRGVLDEGEPHGVAGAFLNGVFEEHPMPYAEEGYGYPEHGQAVVRVADGQVVRLLVDDEPLDVRTGSLERHEQRLELRDGLVRRAVDWTSPAGRAVRVRSERLVSFEHRGVAAIRYAVEAVDGPVTITLQSELVADEPVPDQHPDPRVRDILAHPFEPLTAHALGTAATLVHRTRRSRIGVAVAMDHRVTAPAGVEPSIRTEAEADLARTTVVVRLAAGERVELEKLVGHAWSPDLEAHALRDRAEAQLAAAREDGWEALVRAQRARLDAFWACADVEVEGEPRLQQAVRFALFQLFQASARLDARSVPGKGLTGAGYAGHVFWDFEAFVLPVLTATAPDAAEQALRWRHATLDRARERARTLRLAGASFAWRTIDGRESSGYWPASTAAFHVNAAVALGAAHHVRATGDERFEREAGLEILVETARLWATLVRRDAEGRCHIDGVTGPDEYSAIVDDNAYTNLVARGNLLAAAEAAGRHPDRARDLGASDGEIGGWVVIASALVVPFSERHGVHEHSAGSTERERWDFAASRDRYPLHDHHPYVELYRREVGKQADLVLALHVAHEAFSPEQAAAAFRWSEAITVRDSSLSAAPQAVVAAAVGHLDLAADYLAEAATLDLDDLHRNTDEGLHLASLAGIWTALVAGFGGMRDGAAGLSFSPRLPEQLTRLRFGIRMRGHVLRVDVRPERTEYRLADGSPLALRHFGERVELEAGVPLTLPTPPLADPGPRPEQPAGRAPKPFREAFAG